MAETPEEQPETQRPLTREDVLRLIEENGGTAQGLDLSGRVFEEGVNLAGLDLASIILKDARLPNVQATVLADDFGYMRHYVGDITFDLRGANLQGANLQGAKLLFANLQEAKLQGANLQGATLLFANLQGANLQGANLRGAKLLFANLHEANLLFANLQQANLFEANLHGALLDGAQLSGALLGYADIASARIEFADWSGGYMVGEEKERNFAGAWVDYRTLRTRYTQLGMEDTAGEFFYREKTAQRKSSWSGAYGSEDFWEAVRSRKPRAILRALWPQRPLSWLGSMFMNLLFGYGERPWRVVGWWMGTIVVSSLAYFLWGELSFTDALYYSLVSFPALGYGNWVKEEIIQGWVRWAGPIEALWGVILIALFLTTFVRKMTR